MSEATVPREHLFIGWDVGGWNCDRNPNSRDALFVVDGNRQVNRPGIAGGPNS